MSLIEHEQQKQISIEIVRTIQHLHVLPADFRQIGTDPAHIDVFLAANGEYVRYTVGFEFANQQIADLDRMIDQFRIVFRLVCDNREIARRMSSRDMILAFSMRGRVAGISSASDVFGVVSVIGSSTMTPAQ